jgi:hypothetical protein
VQNSFEVKSSSVEPAQALLVAEVDDVLIAVRTKDIAWLERLLLERSRENLPKR